MERGHRVTTASVVTGISLVLVAVGAAMAVRARSGLTAHVFVPATQRLKVQTLRPSGPPTTSDLEPGLLVTVQRFVPVADYGLKPTTISRFTNVTQLGRSGRAPLESHWRGYLKITDPGLYRFRLEGPESLSMALNGRPMGGLHIPEHRAHSEQSDVFAVRLEAGLHQLAIDQVATFRRARATPFSISWTRSDWNWSSIPAEALWAAPTATGWLEEPPDPHLPPNAPEDEDSADRHLIGLPMHRPGFEASNFLFAAMADHWDFTRLHDMNHFPGYEILWRGQLEVPAKRSFRLAAETGGAIEVQISGSLVRASAEEGGLSWEGELEPGWHDFSVSLVSPWPTESLRLTWDGLGSGDGEEAEMRPLTASNLRPLPVDEVWWASRRGTARGVLVLGLVGLLASLLWLRYQHPSASELRSGLRRSGYATMLCLIMLLGLGLRAYRYNEVPHLQLSSDELHNARKGWHMLHGEGLRAWTPLRYLPYYEEGQIESTIWADLEFNRVRPNFDRPPLFPLAHGVFNAAIGGAPNVWALGPSQIRIFPILLSVLSIPLVAALTRRIYGTRGAALFAALLFAAIPSIALNHRQAKSDILVVLLILLGLLAAFRHLDTGKQRWLWGAALAAGLAPWAKEIGIVAIAIIPYVWLRERRWRDGLTVAAVGAAIFALYFAWGSLVDYELFWNIIQGQGSQASAFDAAWRFLTESKLVHHPLPFAIGWTLWLWIAVAYAAPRDELPTLAAVCFLIVISSLVRIEWIFGWYWVPMFPFLCMAGGVYLYDMVRRPDLVRGALFVLTAILMAIHAQRSGDAEALAATRVVVVATLLPFAIVTFFPGRWTLQAGRVWAGLTILAALVLGASQLVLYE